MHLKGRLLVVDDEPQLLELLSLTLTLNGYSVQEAGSGPEALDYVTREPFDVVILDVVMAPWTGFETAERFRTLVRPPRVLFLTGLHDQESTARGLELGDGYLIKPFRPAELLKKLEDLIHQPS